MPSSILADPAHADELAAVVRRCCHDPHPFVRAEAVVVRSVSFTDRLRRCRVRNAVCSRWLVVGRSCVQAFGRLFHRVKGQVPMLRERAMLPMMVRLMNVRCRRPTRWCSLPCAARALGNVVLASDTHPRHHYHHHHQDHAKRVAQRAVRIIAACGPEGELLLVETLQRDRSATVRASACYGLGQLGVGSLRSLVLALCDSSEQVRRGVLRLPPRRSRTDLAGRNPHPCLCLCLCLRVYRFVTQLGQRCAPSGGRPSLRRVVR